MTNHHLPIPSNTSSNYEASSSNVRTRRGTINGKEYEFTPNPEKRVYACSVGSLRPLSNRVDQKPAQNAIIQTSVLPRYIFTATFGTLQQVGEDEKKQIVFTKLVTIPQDVLRLIIEYLELSFEEALRFAAEDQNHDLFCEQCVIAKHELIINQKKTKLNDLIGIFRKAKDSGIPYKITSIIINRVPYKGERPTDQTLNEISELFPELEKIRFNLISDYYFTTEGFEKLIKNCPNLRMIKIPKIFSLKDSLKNQAISRLFNKYSSPSRQFFDLHWCSKRELVHEALTIFEQEKTATTQNVPISINLSDCRDLTDGDLLRVIRLFRDLQSIDLTDCELISDNSLRELKKHCPQLHMIRVCDCDTLTEDGIISLFQQYGSQLQLLDISYCENVSIDKLFEAFTQRCRNLKTFRLAGLGYAIIDAVSSDIVDKRLTIATRQFPNLKVLDIQQLEITKKGLSAIAEQCKKLHTVYIHGCSLITPQDLQEISSSYPQIHFNSKERF
jgi:hypothetical protein